jgi:hypothetical protein
MFRKDGDTWQAAHASVETRILPPVITTPTGGTTVVLPPQCVRETSWEAY